MIPFPSIIFDCRVFCVHSVSCCLFKKYCFTRTCTFKMLLNSVSMVSCYSCYGHPCLMFKIYPFFPYLFQLADLSRWLQLGNVSMALYYFLLNTFIPYHYYITRLYTSFICAVNFPRVRTTRMSANYPKVEFIYPRVQVPPV